MASKIKVDTLETANGSGTIALQNQLSGMTTASLPTLTSAEMPTGSVIQVVQALDSGDFSTTSSAYADANLSATITPTSTSSKILVLVSQTGFAGNSINPNYNIVRGSTVIIEAYFQTQVNGQSFGGNFLNYLDSPSTTSAVTYKTQAKTNSSTLYLNWGPTGSSTITLMEIQG